MDPTTTETDAPADTQVGTDVAITPPKVPDAMLAGYIPAPGEALPQTNSAQRELNEELQITPSLTPEPEAISTTTSEATEEPVSDLPTGGEAVAVAESFLAQPQTSTETPIPAPAVQPEGNEPNPGFENPVAIGSTTEKEMEEQTGIMTLAEIKTLADSKRKIAFLENRLKDTLTEDTTALGLISEANQDLANAIEEVQREPDPVKKKGLFKKFVVGAIGAVALIKAFLPGGDVDSSDTSGLTDTERVELLDQARNLVGDAGKKLDNAFSGVASPDSLKDISNALTDNDKTDNINPPTNASIYPEKQQTVGPETPLDSQIGLTGEATVPEASALDNTNASTEATTTIAAETTTAPAEDSAPAAAAPAPSSNPYFDQR